LAALGSTRDPEKKTTSFSLEKRPKALRGSGSGEKRDSDNTVNKYKEEKQKGK